MDFGTNFHASLNNHPGQVLVRSGQPGTDLSYSGNALNSRTERDPLPGEDPVPSVPQPSELRTKGFPLPRRSRVGLAYDIVTGNVGTG